MKQDRARRTHARVLNAAAHEFATRGFTATRLQVVAERIGLSKGAIYGHFPSKVALADELTRQFRESWQRLIAEADRGAAAPLQTLDALLTELTERTQNDVRFSAGLRLAVERSPATWPLQVGQLHASFTRLVALAQRRGEVDPGASSDVLARLLLSMTIGFQHSASVIGLGQDGEQARQMWRTLLSAVYPWAS